MPRPLIDTRARPPVLACIVVGLVIGLGLAALVWHGRSTHFDDKVFQYAFSRFGAIGSRRRRAWELFSEPWISFGMPAVIAIWAAIRRDVRMVVLAVVAPLVAIGLTELVGKPLVHRTYVTPGSFPSGHETGTVAWLVVAVVLVFRFVADRTTRIATVLLAVLWAGDAAIGLTVNFYHYATDTIGAIGLTTAVVLIIALVIDLVAARFSSPVGRGRPRTARGV